MSSLKTTKPPHAATHHLICLHGFLGLSNDWELLEPVTSEPWQVHHEALWSHVSDFKTWSTQFCERVEMLQGTKILLGYSLGGRLAMHALEAGADLFDGAILVSSNPGLKTSEERNARLIADQVWAEKFRTLEWSELMTQWNSQNVFHQPANLGSDQIALDRKEKDFDRELLAESLELWSLAHQKDFEPVLKELEIPILFLTGAADTKFTGLMSALSGRPAWGDRPHVVVERAGHRVPWDAPQDFRAMVAKFLRRWYR